MSREAFDIEAALEKCHKGTAWQRDLIRAQLISAQADAFERAAKVCETAEVRAERYRAGMREMIDCRTCRNHTRDGCIQTALCVDADGYRRALPVRFWVATHSAALAEGEAG